MFLKKMTLSACNEKGKPDESVEPFELMLNPESVTIKSSLCYTEQEGCGIGASQTPKFRRQPAKEIVIAPFIIDVTGAIPGSMSFLHASMDEIIDHLEDVVYNIKDDGAPHKILIEWGTTSYNALLTSMDVKYTLFDSDGDPLRAEITLNLMEDPKESLHNFGLTDCIDESCFREVESGDTLSKMCEDVYGDSSYFQDVAEANGLDSTQALVPGQVLYFPPLADE